MNTAVKGASKWLIEHTKKNPVPFKFFKSILDRQIEWARNRGHTINFDDLAQSVRTELLKHGIFTMNEDGTSNGTPSGDTPPLFEADGNTPGEIFPAPLILSLNDNRPVFPAFFGWCRDVFAQAQAKGVKQIRFTAEAR